MKFIDKAILTLRAGKGGDGCMSFRREKFVPRGGPDGGNGGHGGSVFLEATRSLHTLADFEHRHLFAATEGERGRGKKQHGRRGKDSVIHVPCGTLVFERGSEETPLADLTEPGDRFLAARGGRGGRGNAHFANAVRKTPRFAEKGEPGETRTLRLELKLIADVGLVGLPNAGKSSLLAALSNAQPKIASYPFTTLTPNLGVLPMADDRVVIADIPGLIEGASENRGLGHDFLRHIERTRLLVYLFDISDNNVDTVRTQWNILRQEFAEYDKALLEKPFILVGNKIDLLSDHGEIILSHLLSAHATPWNKAEGIFLISAKEGIGIEKLIEGISRFSARHPRNAMPSRLFAPLEGGPNTSRTLETRMPLVIIPENAHTFRIVHTYLERAILRFDFESDEAIIRFNNLLRRHKVEEALEAYGAEEGDTILLGELEFDFLPQRNAEENRSVPDSSEEEHPGPQTEKNKEQQ